MAAIAINKYISGPQFQFKCYIIISYRKDYVYETTKFYKEYHDPYLEYF